MSFYTSNLCTSFFLSTFNEDFLIFVDVEILFLKGPKYRLTFTIDFPKFRREIAASLNDFRNRWGVNEKMLNLMP